MEKHFDFINKLNQVHKPNRINPRKEMCEGYTTVTDEWKILYNDNCGTVLKNAAVDLQEYFCVSMGVKLEIATAEKSEEKTIFISVDDTMSERTFRIKADNCIEIYGSNERLAAQGCYALEDNMNINELPSIEKCDITRHMRFSPRIAQGGLPQKKYTGNLLRQIAHYGFDAVIVIAKKEVLDGGEVCREFNDTIKMASEYGLDVYTFCWFKNIYHPDDEEAYEYYQSTYGKFIKLCPDIKGVILVGEGCEFPSKDEHTTGKEWRKSLDDEKPSPGWFPCCDYPQFASMIKRVIDENSKKTELVLWTYNWFYADEALRTELVRNLPQGVSVMTTFEMGKTIDIGNGATETTTDYSIWQIGPADAFVSESKTAKEGNQRMYTKADSVGGTWDIGGVPYLPAPQRWMKRWKAVTDAQDNWKLDGTQDTWTYGLWPSIISEMAKYAYMLPMPDMNELLRKLIKRDYGDEYVDEIIEIFELFSQGISHCVSTNEDQYGPARVGPSYPLFFKRWELIPPSPETGSSVNFEGYPVYTYNLDYETRLFYETSEYRKMTELFDEGCRRLTDIVAKTEGRKAENLKELLGISKFIANTGRTIQHVKRWHYLKGKLGVYVDAKPTWVGGRKNLEDAKKATKPLVPAVNPEPIVLELIDILKREIANAEDTIPLVDANSRLGYEEEFDYACSREQLEWKIEMAHRTLNEELLPLLSE